MKILWCWRCKIKIPMLDEKEYERASELFGQAIRDTKIQGGRLIRFKPLLEYYKKVTGWDETELNAIMHHRIAQYGPTCENCNKPYRTPQATFCAACGNKRIQKCA